MHVNVINVCRISVIKEQQNVKIVVKICPLPLLAHSAAAVEVADILLFDKIHHIIERH